MKVSLLKIRTNVIAFCIFAIAVNMIALFAYRMIGFSTNNINESNAIKGLFLITIGGQSVLSASLIRHLFFSKNNYSSTNQLGFIELMKYNKALIFTVIYILSAMMVLLYLGSVLKVNLFVVMILSLIALLINMFFFYYVNKYLKPTQSSNIIATNSIVFIFSSCTYTLFGFSKLILMYYPLGGLIFSFFLKN